MDRYEGHKYTTPHRQYVFKSQQPTWAEKIAGGLYVCAILVTFWGGVYLLIVEAVK